MILPSAGVGSPAMAAGSAATCAIASEHRRGQHAALSRTALPRGAASSSASARYPNLKRIA